MLRGAMHENESEGVYDNMLLPSPYCTVDDEPIMIFAEKFVKGKGKFFYCPNENDCVEKLKNLIAYRQWDKVVSFSPSLQTYLSKYGLQTLMDDENTTVGIGLCQALISKTGSIIITSTQGAATHLKHFPPIMIIVAFESQILQDYKTVLENLPQTPPQWVLSIKSGDLVEEEIRELYMFVIAD